MLTIFENLSDSFYTAFYEPDPVIRREKIDAWLRDCSEVIGPVAEKGLQEFIEEILKDTWEFQGWKTRVNKYSSISFMDRYKLSSDMRIRAVEKNDRGKVEIVGPLSPEVRQRTLDAAVKAKNYIASLEPPKPIELKEINLHENNNYRVEVAIPLIEKFIYQCYRENVKRVRIVHGKGIGVLRKAVRDHLTKNELVKSINPVDKDHGGEGATEAVLVEFSAEKML